MIIPESMGYPTAKFTVNNVEYEFETGKDIEVPDEAFEAVWNAIYTSGKAPVVMAQAGPLHPQLIIECDEALFDYMGEENVQVIGSVKEVINSIMSGIVPSVLIINKKNYAKFSLFNTSSVYASYRDSKGCYVLEVNGSLTTHDDSFGYVIFKDFDISETGEITFMEKSYTTIKEDLIFVG